jgi:hypothetical protein
MIRSPIWDSLWFLSGLPIGIALAFGAVPIPMLFACFVWLDSAHLISPIACAWTHRSFRGTMLADKRKYVLMPLCVILIGGILGATVAKTFPVNPVTLGVQVFHKADYFRPLIIFLLVRFVWNAYHFGMQNYGFLRLYRPQMERAATMQWAMFATLFLMFAVPTLFHDPSVALFCFGLVVVNHSLASIGLASHAWSLDTGRSPLWFSTASLMIGAGLGWLILHNIAVIMVIAGLRAAVGIDHFLYDRWLWRDPSVHRAIIAAL